MIRPLLSRSLFSLRNLVFSQAQIYKFSIDNQDNNESKLKDLNRAENFYRNSIRRININERGQGKFTEHHLIRLTKLVQKSSQLPLLYEGYYNYLGHFTVISSRTVDKMLAKSLSFEDTQLESTLEVFQNHNYLGYFPSYQITLQFLNALVSRQGSEELLLRFIKVLIDSPLIKINKEIINRLIQVTNQEQTSKGIYSSISKLLIQRSNFELINEDIKPLQLLDTLASCLEKKIKQTDFRILKTSTYVEKFVDSIKQNQAYSSDLYKKIALLSLSFGSRERYSETLLAIEFKQEFQETIELIKNLNSACFQSMVDHLKAKQDQRVNSYLETIQPKEEQAQEEE